MLSECYRETSSHRRSGDSSHREVIECLHLYLKSWIWVMVKWCFSGEGDSEPLVSIQFSDEANAYLMGNNLEIARVMIQAGIEAAAQLARSTISKSRPQKCQRPARCTEVTAAYSGARGSVNFQRPTTVVLGAASS